MCSRACRAGANASSAASTSSRRARASAATRQPVISDAIVRTASRSPRDAMGKPPSITSTPKSASCRARRSFSGTVIEKPGDCSPSRSVVSKIWMWSILICLQRLEAPGTRSRCVV